MAKLNITKLSEVLWQFHNDRLKDPNLTDITPYIKRVQSVFKADGWIDSNDLKMTPQQIKSMNRIEPDGLVRKPKMKYTAI